MILLDGDLQDLALETGGCVADSLEMARFGRDHPARTLVVAGVQGRADNVETSAYARTAAVEITDPKSGEVLVRAGAEARTCRVACGCWVVFF